MILLGTTCITNPQCLLQVVSISNYFQQLGTRSASFWVDLFVTLLQRVVNKICDVKKLVFYQYSTLSL